jgi:RNA polymerase sigma-70 factor (ECF subfamily)
VERVEPTDETLCRQAADREPGAFDLLVERYQERAYRIAWSILRDREAAKDCSQEAFLRLHESASSFAGQSRFSTWFYRILVNCALDQQRRGRGWKRLLVWREPESPYEAGGDPIEQHPAPLVDPTDAVEDERRVSQIWSAVEGLSPKQRAAVLLSCREGLPTKEVAAILGMSEATVRVHMHRAFQTLRRRLRSDS